MHLPRGKFLLKAFVFVRCGVANKYQAILVAMSVLCPKGRQNWRTQCGNMSSPGPPPLPGCLTTLRKHSIGMPYVEMPTRSTATLALHIWDLVGTSQHISTLKTSSIWERPGVSKIWRFRPHASRKTMPRVWGPHR